MANVLDSPHALRDDHERGRVKNRRDGTRVPSRFDNSSQIKTRLISNNKP